MDQMPCSEPQPSAAARTGRLGVLACWLALSAALGDGAHAQSAAPGAAKPSAATEVAGAAEAVAVTGAGQRIYERTRSRLLQVRTLLKTQDSQSSVGSGFLVDGEAHLITNYHVVSQFALQPDRHRLVYATVDGRQGALQLLAFDVVHDLALLKAVDPAPLAGRGAVELRPENEPLPRGARVFSMGNPLDVGFAVAEGNYNGPTERSFLPTLFFGGSLSGGMSGGPALDEMGRLVGVNVAARRDGEQVSFLVPADPVRKLIARGRGQTPLNAPAWPEITRQLMQHEAHLAQRFIALPWRHAGHPDYTIPVPQETFMRCWGRGAPQATRGLQFERSDCEMDSRIFVSGTLLTGYVTVRHEAYDGSRIGTLRFQDRYSASFANEFVGLDDRLRTAAQCVERTVPAAPRAAATAKNAAPLLLRAVICMRAYKKLEGLHDLSVLVATLDGRIRGVQGRLDAHGVSLASAQRLARHYLDGFAWNPATPPETTPPSAKAASR
jgi:S1-C subfamily serine protease